jgi:Ni/Co efflux regulator RcnB
MLRRIVLAVAVASLAAGATAQSLGDVARKEKKRRENNKAKGIEVREIGEDEIFDDEDESSEDENPNAGEVGETESETPSEDGTGLSLGTDPDTERLDRERQERRRSEAEWRSRLHEAQARLTRARERQEVLKGLHLAQGERYVDAQGRTVVESLEHLQRLVREADEAVAAAEKSLADLREEARRSGVPPGWLR